MGLLDNISIPKRQCHILILIGNSESMTGSKIGSVNDAIENVLPMIREISEDNPDAAIYFNVMFFSDNCKWLYDSPTPISNFVYRRIESHGKGNCLGECYKSLNSYLVRLQNKVSCDALYSPIIMILADRNSSDETSNELQNLRNNHLFNSAIKIAIQIGDKIDSNVLTEFTGSSSTVITIHSIGSLNKLIRLQPLSKVSYDSNQNKRDVSNNKLNNAIDHAIKEFGEKVVTEERFVSILCDYHGFEENQSAKHILRNAINMGYLDKLVAAKNDNLKTSSIISDFSNITGFRQELVYSLFSQLVSSLTKIPPKRAYQPWQVPVIFLIDASDEMYGSKNRELNSIMENIISILSDFDKKNLYTKVKISCITFGDDTVWTDKSSKSISEFVWKGIVGKGKCNIGKAFQLLRKDFKLYFNDVNHRQIDPIYFLISCSKAIDDYKTVLTDLLSFYELEYSTRIGIKIGDDADIELLKMFTESNENIFSIHDLEQLRNMKLFWYSYPELPAIDEPLKTLLDNGLG